jgi:hypothetical protein
VILFTPPLGITRSFQACAPRRAASCAYLRRSTHTSRALPQLAPPPCMASRKAAARRPSEPCDTVELAAPIHSNGAPTNEVDATRGSGMPSRVRRASSRRRRCPRVPPWCEDQAADHRPPCTRVRPTPSTSARGEHLPEVPFLFSISCATQSKP